MSNTYLMFFQTDILAAVQKTRYIFIVDCSAYFLSMMCQFRTSTSFYNYFSSKSKNIQDSCHKLSQHICLCTMYDELNSSVTLQLFLSVKFPYS